MPMEPCGHLHLRAEMPSGPVEPPEDWRARPRSHGVRTRRQGQRQGRDGDRGQEQPPGLARAWPHKGIEIAPLVPVLDDGGGVRSAGAPDAPQDGREADTLVVGRP